MARDVTICSYARPVTSVRPSCRPIGVMTAEGHAVRSEDLGLNARERRRRIERLFDGAVISLSLPQEVKRSATTTTAKRIVGAG